MNDKKLIKNFETISNFDKYSKYSSVLDREFKEKSLKAFIVSLKHYKTKEKENFIEEFYKKYPYQFEGKQIIINDDSLFENILKYKERIENELKAKNDKRLIKNDSLKKFKENEIPDSLRYNPNYDSIFKKVPGFKMVYNKKPDKKILKSKILNSKIFEGNKSNDNSKDNKIKLEAKNKNKCNNLFKTNIKINNPKNKYNNKKNIFLNLPQITFKNINSNIKEGNNKNKKFNTLEAKSNKEFTLSELNINKYKQNSIKEENHSNYKFSNILNYNNNIINNKIMNFGKMSSRNDKFIINSYSLDVPSFEKYYPKYTYVENGVKNIKFYPFGSNKNNKKFLLKKMMNSYNVPTEYQFIDNEKLTNDNDLIKRQLILNHNIYPLK